MTNDSEMPVEIGLVRVFKIQYFISQLTDTLESCFFQTSSFSPSLRVDYTQNRFLKFVLAFFGAVNKFTFKAKS